MSSNRIIWSIKEITQLLRLRQKNKFDANFGVSGNRGNGKSTIIFHIFNSYKKEGFNQKKHQVYSQKAVINLLSSQEMGFCWDDEAINSGYKRDFQKAGQKDLIKIVTNFRDNFNIYGSALPFFYSLDKALRELIFMHIHIIERGLAVILLPLEDQIHAQDPWDTNYNIKIEEREHKRMLKDPNLKFRYHKFSTFAGYVYFGKMSKKQEEFYKKIKKEKRADNFREQGVIGSEENISFRQRLYILLKEGKLTKDGLVQASLSQGERFSTVSADLNRMLKDEGILDKTMMDFIRNSDNRIVHSRDKGSINDLVPSF